MWAPCSKSRRKVPLRRLRLRRESSLLSPTAFLANCHSSSNLPFNDVLCEKNWNYLSYWHGFNHKSCYPARPVLNANIRACTSYAESLRSHNSYFVACTCIRILLQATVLTWNEFNCFYFPSWYTRVLPSLWTVSLLMRWKRLRAKGLWVVFFFSVHVITQSIRGWLTQEVT